MREHYFTYFFSQVNRQISQFEEKARNASNMSYCILQYTTNIIKIPILLISFDLFIDVYENNSLKVNEFVVFLVKATQHKRCYNFYS